MRATPIQIAIYVSYICLCVGAYLFIRPELTISGLPVEGYEWAAASEDAAVNSVSRWMPIRITVLRIIIPIIQVVLLPLLIFSSFFSDSSEELLHENIERRRAYLILSSRELRVGFILLANALILLIIRAVFGPEWLIHAAAYTVLIVLILSLAVTVLDPDYIRRFKRRPGNSHLEFGLLTATYFLTICVLAITIRWTPPTKFGLSLITSETLGLIELRHLAAIEHSRSIALTLLGLSVAALYLTLYSQVKRFRDFSSDFEDDYQLAHALLLDGQSDAASLRIAKVVAEYPSNPRSYYLRSHEEFAQGNVRRALDDVRTYCESLHVGSSIPFVADDSFHQLTFVATEIRPNNEVWWELIRQGLEQEISDGCLWYVFYEFARSTNDPIPKPEWNATLAQLGVTRSKYPLTRWLGDLHLPSISSSSMASRLLNFNSNVPSDLAIAKLFYCWLRASNEPLCEANPQIPDPMLVEVLDSIGELADTSLPFWTRSVVAQRILELGHFPMALPLKGSILQTRARLRLPFSQSESARRQDERYASRVLSESLKEAAANQAAGRAGSASVSP
jgi:hypothetical protein